MGEGLKVPRYYLCRGGSRLKPAGWGEQLAQGKENPNLPKTFSQLFYHFVWATKGREPIITPEVEARLKDFVFRKCEELGYFLHALGAVDDHIHTLVGMPPALSPATFAQRIKGGSSRTLKEQDGRLYLYWQEGYGVLTISKSDLDRVKVYVENQRQRHQLGKVWATFERTEEDQGSDESS